MHSESQQQSISHELKVKSQIHGPRSKKFLIGKLGFFHTLIIVNRWDTDTRLYKAWLFCKRGDIQNLCEIIRDCSIKHSCVYYIISYISSLYEFLLIAWV